MPTKASSPTKNEGKLFCREIEWTAFRETASFKTRSYENLLFFISQCL